MQAKVVQELSQEDVYLYNPRRDQWDASLEQSINNATFRQQVEWELDALQAADWIVMYFDPTTKSPITLLEFGLWMTSKKLIVACPHGFWRRGNLEVCCVRAGIPLYETLDELIADVKKKIHTVPKSLKYGWGWCEL